MHHQPDIDKCEGWRKFYRLLKNVCCLTGFLNLSAELIYFTNLQWAHQSLWVILFLPEPTAKIQATHPNSYKIIISPFPGNCPWDPRQVLNGETCSSLKLGRMKPAGHQGEHVDLAKTPVPGRWRVRYTVPGSPPHPTPTNLLPGADGTCSSSLVLSFTCFFTGHSGPGGHNGIRAWNIVGIQ